jgi:hypothetical protein
MDKTEVWVNGGKDVSLDFPEEGITTSTPLTQVGTNLYRLEAVPTFSDANYHDIVEGEWIDAETLRVRRVVQTSGWQTQVYILSREVIAHGKVQQHLQRVLAMGGYWEQIFGGMLYICLPPGAILDFEENLLS